MIYKILTKAHESFYVSFQPTKWFRHFIRWNTTTLSQSFS